MGFVYQNKKNNSTKKISENSLGRICQTRPKNKKKYIFFFVKFCTTKQCLKPGMGSAQPRKLSFLVQAQKHDPQTKKKERKSKGVFHLNLKPRTPRTQRRNPKIKVKI